MNPLFNAGVLLIDVREWNRRKITEQCLSFCQKYGAELPSHDQTVLNIVLCGSTATLPLKFNHLISPDTRYEQLDPCVMHFVASPKPWDLFSGLIHPYAKMYRRELRGTMIWSAHKKRYLELSNYRRVRKIFRGYARTFANRYFRS